jgi:hypothetical protein
VSRFGPCRATPRHCREGFSPRIAIQFGMQHRVFKALGAAIACALAACSSSEQSAAPIAPNALAQIPVRSSASLAKTDLLYIANGGENTVSVYAFRSGKLVQTIGPLGNVNGLCVDPSQNVWIPNGSELDRYAHGATQSSATLQDPGEYPASCSVDPKHGSIAITNVPVKGHAGNVGIYLGGTGTLRTYTNSHFRAYGSCAFDDNGDLYVFGINKQKKVVLAEITYGGSTLTLLKLIDVPSPILIPGEVQFDKGYLAIESQLSPVAIYQVTFARKTARVVSTTPINNVQVSAAFWIAGKTVVVPDTLAGEIDYFNYPAGGDPTKSIQASGEPVGVVVSKGT